MHGKIKLSRIVKMFVVVIVVVLPFEICVPLNLTKTHNWVEWTAASVSFSQTKGNNISLNDSLQMQNDTENEIGRSLFPFIHGLRIVDT